MSGHIYSKLHYFWKQSLGPEHPLVSATAQPMPLSAPILSYSGLPKCTPYVCSHLLKTAQSWKTLEAKSTHLCLPLTRKAQLLCLLPHTFNQSIPGLSPIHSPGLKAKTWCASHRDKTPKLFISFQGVLFVSIISRACLAARKEQLYSSLCDVVGRPWQNPPTPAPTFTHWKYDFWAAQAILSNFRFQKQFFVLFSNFLGFYFKIFFHPIFFWVKEVDFALQLSLHCFWLFQQRQRRRSCDSSRSLRGRKTPCRVRKGTESLVNVISNEEGEQTGFYRGWWSSHRSFYALSNRVMQCSCLICTLGYAHWGTDEYKHGFAEP